MKLKYLNHSALSCLDEAYDAGVYLYMCVRNCGIISISCFTVVQKSLFAGVIFSYGMSVV